MPDRLKLAGMPTPQVSAGEMLGDGLPQAEHVVSQTPGETHPEPPHRAVSVISEGTDAVGRGAKLLNDYGPATIVVSVFLIMFVVGAYLVRHDYLAADKALIEANERSLKSQSDAFLKVHADHREDTKEDRAMQREAQAKMWGGMRDMRDATQEQTRAVQELLREFKKIAERMQ